VRASAPRLRLTRRGTVDRTVLLSVLAATTAQANRLTIADTGVGAGARAIRVAQDSVADWVTLDPAVCILTPEGLVLERKTLLDRPFTVAEAALADGERRHAAPASRP